jgi:8-oxo-dGTP pyrophosphatase MutT (NUDIX family)
LVAVPPNYLKIAWHGLVSPRLGEREPVAVSQAVILSERQVLLAVRADLRGWELPGGHVQAGESSEVALIREVREETGLEIAIERHVGDYVRTGFRPYTASVFVCRVAGGALRPSVETPVLRWFDGADPPDTLFPWFREPLADALTVRAEPVARFTYQGAAAVWAGFKIDLRMRWSDDRAGLSGSRKSP